MRRSLPTTDAVRAAMDSVLASAAAAGRRPTITAVERRLGIPHPTFYRHYQQLITDYFQPRSAASAPSNHSTTYTTVDERAGPYPIL